MRLVQILYSDCCGAPNPLGVNYRRSCYSTEEVRPNPDESLTVLYLYADEPVKYFNLY